MDYTKNIYQLFAEKAAEQWSALGYDVKTRGLYAKEFAVALKERDFDVIGVNTNMCSVDPFAYLAPFAKEYSGTGVYINPDEESVDEIFNPHYTNLDDEEYNAFINSIVYVTDRAQRAALLHTAEEMLVKLCPAAPVIWYNNSYVASDEVSGIKNDNWFGYYDLKKLKLSDWREVNEAEAETSERREQETSKR